MLWMSTSTTPSWDIWKRSKLGSALIHIVNLSLHLGQDTWCTEGINQTVIADRPPNSILCTKFGSNSNGCSWYTHWQTTEFPSMIGYIAFKERLTTKCCQTWSNVIKAGERSRGPFPFTRLHDDSATCTWLVGDNCSSSVCHCSILRVVSAILFLPKAHFRARSVHPQYTKCLARRSKLYCGQQYYIQCCSV